MRLATIDDKARKSTYRVSLKKGTFLVFALFHFQRSDFTFSYVFWNQNFEPVSFSHSNNALGALKKHKNPCTDFIFIQVLRCEAWAVLSLQIVKIQIKLLHNQCFVIYLYSKPNSLSQIKAVSLALIKSAHCCNLFVNLDNLSIIL